jgi:hypothetical protein
LLVGFSKITHVLNVPVYVFFNGDNKLDFAVILHFLHRENMDLGQLICGLELSKRPI